MIVAAGLGTRLRPLTELRPKPAVPIRGIPLIGYTLAWLAHSGVDEVVVNVHHLPELLRAEAERWCPPGVRLHFSHERELLLTGGAIRRVADFLAGSDPSVVVGGDMLLDLDLRGALERHRASGRGATLLLRDDPRTRAFGSIGLDAAGRLRRVGRRFDLGGSTQAGVNVWVGLLSRAVLETLPERDVFNHLDDWLAPLAAAGGAVGGEVLAPEACVWEPVGTPAEYLAANFAQPSLSYLDVEAAAARAGTRLERELVVGAGAQVGAGARLERVVIWEGERVPAGAVARGGVYAGGRFHECDEPASAAGIREAPGMTTRSAR